MGQSVAHPQKSARTIRTLLEMFTQKPMVYCERFPVRGTVGMFGGVEFPGTEKQTSTSLKKFVEPETQFGDPEHASAGRATEAVEGAAAEARGSSSAWTAAEGERPCGRMPAPDGAATLERCGAERPGKEESRKSPTRRPNPIPPVNRARLTVSPSAPRPCDASGSGRTSGTGRRP